MSLQPEEAEMVALMDYMARAHPAVRERIIHIANERRCSVARGRKLKRMGVRAGVSDIFLPIARGGCHGLWIEMKARGGRLTDSQKRWLRLVAGEGYMAAVAHGWQQAAELIEGYLGIGRRTIKNAAGQPGTVPREQVRRAVQKVSRGRP